MSGNVGDTLNVMPVLSGIFKSTGHAISLVVRDKMKIFNGFRELLLMQECVCSVKYESDVTIDSTYNILSLVESFDKHTIRPWETVRLEEDFRRRYNIDFMVDDSFELNTPVIEPINKFIVGDRMSHPEMDQRRQFNVLQNSGKFPLDRCMFLDYNQSMVDNAALIKASSKPIFSTFTGISVIADLLKKETVVLWGDDLKNWDNKPIEYSFNKHFYRNRNCRLAYLGDFDISHYEENYEVQ
jgi:hypothetical protein